MTSIASTNKIFGFTFHRRIHRQLRDHFIPHEGNNHRPHVLGHRVLFLYAVLLVLVKITALSAPLLLPYNSADSAAVTIENIITLTNQDRAAAGLADLSVSQKLSEAAKDKARDMMDKAYFAHFSPEGLSPWYWINQAGYNYSFAGENLAIRFDSAEGLNAAWLSSAAHRANILSKDFSEIGVAVATGKFGNQGEVTLVVQMFGHPGSSVASDIENNSDAGLRVNKIISDSSLNQDLPVGAVAVLFPLKNSFVNKSEFKIIGRSESGSYADIYIDNKLIGQTVIPASFQFDYLLPTQLALANGPHQIFIQTKDDNGQPLSRSQTVSFSVDTTPPVVDENSFVFLPVASKLGQYQASVKVSDDSIRTIILIGENSTVMDKSVGGVWTATVSVGDDLKNQKPPIEILVQDMAGNENRVRLGWINQGGVKGLFTFTAGGKPEGSNEISLFSGLLKIKNLDSWVKSFYLAFIIFLTGSLILKIAIKRHIQHPKTIAAASLVVMLAAVFIGF